MSVIPLREIAAVVRGVSFDKGEAVDEARDGFLPILRAGNIESELVLDRDLVWVPAIRVAPEQRMRPDDIAICMSSGSPAIVGKTAPLRREWNGSVGAFCALIRPQTDRILPAYLSYFFKSERFRQWTRQSAGANIKNVRKSELESFPVPRPSLEEQRRIVDLLSRAEGIVRLRHEAQKKAQAITSALFLDMFGDPAINPKGWRMCAIEDLCSVRTGATPKKERRLYYEGGQIPWVRTGEVCEGEIHSAEERITELAVAETNCKVFPVDTILVAMYGQGQTRGRSGILKIPAATNQACAAILPGDRIRQPFLFEILKIQYERLRAMGRGGNQANLNLGMIKSLQVPTPPDALQTEFGTRAAEVRSIINQQRAATSKAEAIFQSVLARAFSGELTAGAAA